MYAYACFEPNADSPNTSLISLVDEGNTDADTNPIPEPESKKEPENAALPYFLASVA